jgi:hypothetical protein
MATYKVIQDIEAEDKLVGPLSLRQFVYAGIGAFLIYLNVLVFIKGAPFLMALFLPPALFCFFFAWPWSPDQPTEVWALARIRFALKPRRRVWDQSGVKELVTITAPKRVEKTYTDGLSQTEVKSRLSALADTIDSRGWVIKNSNVNLSPAMPYLGQQASDSDRLISYASMPQDVPTTDITAQDDMLDEHNNPIAQQFDQMISKSAQTHREKIMEKLRRPATPEPANAEPPADYWFLHQNDSANGNGKADDVVFANAQVVQPGVPQQYGPVAAEPTPAEEALAKDLASQNKIRKVQNSHLKTIHTPEELAVLAEEAAKTPVIPPLKQADPAILNLANNNDLSVATIAHEANRKKHSEPSDGEVVISLR